MVTGDAATFGLSRMTEAFLKDVPFYLKIFWSIEEARSWLLARPAEEPPAGGSAPSR